MCDTSIFNLSIDLHISNDDDEELHTMKSLLNKENGFISSFFMSEELSDYSTNHLSIKNFCDELSPSNASQEDENMNKFQPSCNSEGENSSSNSLSHIKETNKQIKGKSYSTDVNIEIKKILEENNIPFTSKYRQDGLRKKIKVHFLNWLNKKLNKEVVKCLGNKMSKFIKMSQEIVSEINIEETKKFLLSPIHQIFQEDSNENNKWLMRELLSKNDINTMEFLTQTMLEVYQDYLCNGLEADLKKFNLRHEAPYVMILKMLALNFVGYFMQCGPNKVIQKTKNKKKKSYTSNEISQTTNTVIQPNENIPAVEMVPNQKQDIFEFLNLTETRIQTFDWISDEEMDPENFYSL